MVLFPGCGHGGTWSCCVGKHGLAAATGPSCSPITVIRNLTLVFTRGAPSQRQPPHMYADRPRLHRRQALGTLTAHCANRRDSYNMRCQVQPVKLSSVWTWRSGRSIYMHI
jgi:hypothetical protein